MLHRGYEGQCHKKEEREAEVEWRRSLAIEGAWKGSTWIFVQGSRVLSNAPADRAGLPIDRACLKSQSAPVPTAV